MSQYLQDQTTSDHKRHLHEGFLSFYHYYSGGGGYEYMDVLPIYCSNLIYRFDIW